MSSFIKFKSNLLEKSKLRLRGSVWPLFLAVGLFVPKLGYGSYRFDSYNLRAYQELLAFRLDNVAEWLDKSLREDQDNGLTLYLSNLYSVSRILISEDQAQYQAHLKGESVLLKKISNLEKNSPYYLFVLSEVRLQNGLARLKMGDDFSALNSLQKAYSLTVENAKKYPDFIPTLRSLGLYQSVLGSLPQSYRWISNLIGIRSIDCDSEEGKMNLEKVAQSGTIFALEAEVLHYLIEGYLYSRYEFGYEKMADVYQRYPKNALFGMFTAMLAIHAGKSTTSLAIIDKLPTQPPYPSLDFVNYLRCEINLFLGNYEQCIFWGNKFLLNYKGHNYIKDTHFKMSLAYLLDGNVDMWKRHKELTLKVGTSRSVQDKQAENFYQQKMVPSLGLLRARLFFDGGLYDKALQQLQSAQVRQDETLEFHYRMARIWQGKKNAEKAIEYYTKTINMDVEKATFFSANSCLQMAYIYRDVLNDSSKSLLYLKKVFQHKKYSGKEAIEYKAKLAIKKLE